MCGTSTLRSYEWAPRSGPYLCSTRVCVHPWKLHLREQKVADTTHILLLLHHLVWNLVTVITIYCKVPQFKYQAIIAYRVLAPMNLVNTWNIQDIYLHGRPAYNIYENQRWVQMETSVPRAKLSVLESQIGTLREGKSVLDSTLLRNDLLHSSWEERLDKLITCLLSFLSTSAAQVVWTPQQFISDMGSYTTHKFSLQLESTFCFEDIGQEIRNVSLGPNNVGHGRGYLWLWASVQP